MSKTSLLANGKIRFYYIDSSVEQPKKYVKILTKETKIFDIPHLLFKGEIDNSIKYDLILPNKTFSDQNLTLEDILPYIISTEIPLQFKPREKKGNFVSSTFYTIEDMKGHKVEYNEEDTENFVQDKLNINDKDYYSIFNSNGEEIEVTNSNYKETIKSEEKYFLIRYPKIFKQEIKEKKKEVFSDISELFNIELPQLKQLLCIFYILDINNNTKKQIFRALQNEKCRPFSTVIESIRQSKEEHIIDDENCLNFIYTLTFLKKEQKFVDFFRSLCHSEKRKSTKYFPEYESSNLSFLKNVCNDAIINFDDENCGVFKKFTNNEMSIEYFDPFENDFLNYNIDFSVISEPDQITAIFVDTSGTMRLAFNDDGDTFYEAACAIANRLIEEMRGMSIRDPVFLYTGIERKVCSKQLPLHLSLDEVSGKTFLFDKIEEILSDILSKKYRKKCPIHIVLITDGDDTASETPRMSALKDLLSEKVIVDSIILHDDDDSQDTYKLARYTNGVYTFASSVDEAVKFVTQEPFFDIRLREQIDEVSIDEERAFEEAPERQTEFEQLEMSVNEKRFYNGYKNGILKPSLKKFADEIEKPIVKELNECLSAESQGDFFTFLVVDDDKDAMLRRWCVFVRFEDDRLWQLEVVFDEMFPGTRPSMRVLSHPELIDGFGGYITPFGTVVMRNAWKGTMRETLENLVEFVRKSDKCKFGDFKGRFHNRPVSDIRKLRDMFRVTFEDGWEVADDESDESEEAVDFNKMTDFSKIKKKVDDDGS